MNSQTLTLIFTAALLHAVWNIILKTAKDNLTALWLQMLVTIIYLVPFSFICFGLPPKEALPTLIFSGVMQAAYYVLLGKCYQSGNLSIVYPLTRGSAPVFVCIFSVVLGLETLTFPVFFSLLWIVSGIYIVNVPAFDSKNLLAPFRTLIADPSTRLSMLVGVTIALYTLSDKINVRYTSPFLVYAIITLIPTVLLAPVLCKKEKVKAELAGKGKLRILAISVFMVAAYCLVLLAMTACNASYISSIREVSVVFVALYTSLRSKNPNWQPKIIGSVIIFTGIVLVSYLTSAS